MGFKPKTIQLPLAKMAGCPWNLLDARGARVAWCGTDNNHEQDGELIANDLLNLVAMGEAVWDLNEQAQAKIVRLEQERTEFEARVAELEGALLKIARRNLMTNAVERDNMNRNLAKRVLGLD